MATAAVDFTHFDLTMHKGDEIDDDDPLVALAPHLFVQPDHVPEADVADVRICGPLVDNPAPGVDPDLPKFYAGGFVPSSTPTSAAADAVAVDELPAPVPAPAEPLIEPASEPEPETPPDLSGDPPAITENKES